jgi:hypothetical protein
VSRHGGPPIPLPGVGKYAFRLTSTPIRVLSLIIHMIQIDAATHRFQHCDQGPVEGQSPKGRIFGPRADDGVTFELLPLLCLFLLFLCCEVLPWNFCLFGFLCLHTCIMAFTIYSLSSNPCNKLCNINWIDEFYPFCRLSR